MTNECVSDGIVLRTQPKEKSVWVLDRNQGHIRTYIKTICPSVGAWITYAKVMRANYLNLHNIQLYESPLNLSRHNILFLHHIVEICFYFIPIESHVDGVFELLQFLYTVDYSKYESSAKKLYLMKLFEIIGMYPEMLAEHHILIRKWSALSVPKLLATQITADQEKMLNRWLHICIADHPKNELFKTLSFLTNVGAQ